MVCNTEQIQIVIGCHAPKQLIEWGLDWTIFEKSVEVYPNSNPKDIPFRGNLVGSVDFDSATNPQGANQLQHNLKLTPYLSEIIPKIKIKYE